jgi:hypothetical protein
LFGKASFFSPPSQVLIFDKFINFPSEDIFIYKKIGGFSRARKDFASPFVEVIGNQTTGSSVSVKMPPKVLTNRGPLQGNEAQEYCKKLERKRFS